MTPRPRLLAWFVAVAVALTGAAPLPAAAQSNTVSILNQTISALPSCLKYELRGVCFWLHCSFVFCSIRSSFKVRHYVPDVVISTYNEPLKHPWTEIGVPLSTTMAVAGGALMGGLLDSSANVDRVGQGKEEITFKAVDVIGNPVGQIAQMLAGASPALPSAFVVPGVTELMSFPSQMPSILQAWAKVPTDLGGELVQSARSLAAAPGELLSKINTIANLGSNVFGAASINTGSLGSAVTKFTDLQTGPLKAVSVVLDLAGGGSFLCPGSATMFGLHYFSDLDAPFWRSLIPLEMLYPGSWVPGINEVSHSGLASTWGSIYPRTGSIAQVNPVKASAVIAARAASIVTQSGQPHIYSRLKPGGDVRYFETFGAPRWQMVSPSSTGCITFGANDSLSLTSFGDGKTSSSQGYIWNLWHRYECCSRRGSYLFSVP